MLPTDFEEAKTLSESVIIKESFWLRAKFSGLLHLKVICGTYVEKGAHIATITDPYGTMRHVVKASKNGYIMNTNESPIVYQGDALFRIGK